MANHMKEVAEILGVEFNEEFKIKGMIGIRYKLTKNGVELSYKGSEMWITSSDMLRLLLDGTHTCTVIKKPWKPSFGEKYYSPDTNNGGFRSDYWVDSDEDEKRYKRGVICETEKEAIAKEEIMLNALRKYNESQE